MTLEETIDNSLVQKAGQLINASKNIILTCHVSPDGDAIGSTLAFQNLLQTMGKNATVITPDRPPMDFVFLPGFRNIIAYSMGKNKADNMFKSADLILCLDYNGIHRVSEMGETLSNTSCPKIMIDHHIEPETFCDVTISYPAMTSTCELLFRVINQLGWLDMMNEGAAECLYTGMMTDTGNFSYNSNKPDLYLMIAELIKKGINKDRIYKLVMKTESENRMRLIGYAIAEKMEIYPEAEAAFIVLDKNDLNRFNYQKGDTETLANMPLAIPEVKWSTFFREETGYIKVSMRSEGEFKVNTLCSQYFNGGGHANAAGGEFRGTLEDAILTYRRILLDLKLAQR